MWGGYFASTVIAVGAVRSAADPCLFIWRHLKHGVIFIVVHVDDVLVAANTLAVVGVIKQVIKSAYTIRDLREVRDFSGMRITRDRAARTLTLASPGHTRALVSGQRLGSANLAKTPMASGTVLVPTETGLIADGGPAYAELVGGLLYLATTTQPDIAFATGVLSRFMHAPEESHWRAAKQVLRYLAGTAIIGLCFWRGWRVGGLL